MTLRSGTIEEVRRESGRWLFVDIGFASESPTCGLLRHDGYPQRHTFAGMVAQVLHDCAEPGDPLNLLLEAPLSVAFSFLGNPTYRTAEHREGWSPRYWYLGLGCGVMVAAMYLVRRIADVGPAREVRLFEGFASFKTKGVRSSHKDDVRRLRDAAWKEGTGEIWAPDDLRQDASDNLISAFAVMGLDLGIPPVIVVEA